jgi:hypothetical protein
MYMSEILGYKKIYELFKEQKEKLKQDTTLKNIFLQFVERWLNIKSESPLIFKERDKWDDEIAIVVFMLKEIGEEEKFKEWYSFWKSVFGRDFEVEFNSLENKTIIRWR